MNLKISLKVGPGISFNKEKVQNRKNVYGITIWYLQVGGAD